MSELERFKNVVAKLRDHETGCPWDKVQTMMSLRRYLIEEAGEYLDALEAGDFDAVKDEMGDLLMQVVLNCRIAEEEGKFTLEDVAKSEADKMIRRHPHVFQGVELKTEQDRIDSWDKIKKSEKDDGRRSALDGVARSMPGLARAQKVLDKAGRVGFEWADFNGAMAKVEEELAEVKEAAAADDAKALEEELGDLLFTVVNLCRWKNLQGRTDDIPVVNAMLQQYCDEQGITFINLFPFFTARGGKAQNVLIRYLSVDGLHLSRPGYTIWAQRLQPFVDEV
ncbi:MAG: nucleoside triphosphate pyrophosphohydrolase, partial [Victivallales bacterium]|nr:nucleoside triphosphate pyrophosphohydrolase [Victivallales bacterium]